MLELTTTEAKLYQLLSALFGRDQVVPHMRVVAVCGGEIPVIVGKSELPQCPELGEWGNHHRATFTIVDAADLPKMVVEVATSTREVIDLEELDHQRVMAVVLRAAGIRYIVVAETEVMEMLDPNSSLDLVSFLRSQVEGQGLEDK